MIINKKPHKSKYKKLGYYITVKFMHGDCDSYTNADYFIPEDENSITNLANFLYLCKNLEWDAYGQSKLIQRIAPCYQGGFYFDWPFDQTGYDGLAKFYGAKIIYWDGKQLIDCDVKLEEDDKDVDEHVKKLIAYWDYAAHAEDDWDYADEGWDALWDQEAEEAWEKNHE